MIDSRGRRSSRARERLAALLSLKSGRSALLKDARQAACAPDVRQVGGHRGMGQWVGQVASAKGTGVARVGQIGAWGVR